MPKILRKGVKNYLRKGHLMNKIIIILSNWGIPLLAFSYLYFTIYDLGNDNLFDGFKKMSSSFIFWYIIIVIFVFILVLYVIAKYLNNQKNE